MIVVAWLYNTNGMATWCWEAAHAMTEAGRDVVLVCRPGQALPGTPSVRIIEFEPPASVAAPLSVFNNLTALIEGLSAAPRTFLGPLHWRLLSQGIRPEVYLLNQSDLHSPDVPVPQYIAGWANPPTLSGYLHSIVAHGGWVPSRRLVRAAIACIGWYRKDWRAYRRSSGVLAVSRRLASAIDRTGIRVSTVHPATVVHPRAAAILSHATPPQHIDDGRITFVIAALDLDDPRKGVAWMLRSMRGLASEQSLVLIGQASNEMRRLAEATGMSVRLTGRLIRAETLAEVARCDVFLFGSVLDDWGYVLSEAMAQGLAVVAPNKSPFDEIVGDGGCMFRPGNADDFRRAVRTVGGTLCRTYQGRAIRRAATLFSREAFADQLAAAITFASHALTPTR